MYGRMLFTQISERVSVYTCRIVHFLKNNVPANRLFDHISKTCYTFFFTQHIKHIKMSDEIVDNLYFNSFSNLLFTINYN